MNHWLWGGIAIGVGAVLVTVNAPHAVVETAQTVASVAESIDQILVAPAESKAIPGQVSWAFRTTDGRIMEATVTAPGAAPTVNLQGTIAGFAPLGMPSRTEVSVAGCMAAFPLAPPCVVTATTAWWESAETVLVVSTLQYPGVPPQGVLVPDGLLRHPLPAGYVAAGPAVIQSGSFSVSGVGVVQLVAAPVRSVSTGIRSLALLFRSSTGAVADIVPDSGWWIADAPADAPMVEVHLVRVDANTVDPTNPFVRHLVIDVFGNGGAPGGQPTATHVRFDTVYDVTGPVSLSVATPGSLRPLSATAVQPMPGYLLDAITWGGTELVTRSDRRILALRAPDGSALARVDYLEDKGQARNPLQVTAPTGYRYVHGIAGRGYTSPAGARTHVMGVAEDDSGNRVATMDVFLGMAFEPSTYNQDTITVWAVDAQVGTGGRLTTNLGSDLLDPAMYPQNQNLLAVLPIAGGHRVVALTWNSADQCPVTGALRMRAP